MAETIKEGRQHKESTLNTLASATMRSFRSVSGLEAVTAVKILRQLICPSKQL